MSSPIDTRRWRKACNLLSGCMAEVYEEYTRRRDAGDARAPSVGKLVSEMQLLLARMYQLRGEQSWADEVMQRYVERG